jgi:DNA-binding LacI/PurR family transcriptional regulator
MGSLREIAQEAGVSLSTVSRALRGSEAISEQTRKRVVEIAERINYLPNKAAQMLVDRKSGRPAVSTLIGVVYGAEIAPNDYYFSTVIKSIVDEAALDGFSTFISPVAGGYDGLMSFAKRLRSLHTTGLVLVGNIAEQSVAALRSWSPNIVVVDKPSTDLTCVYNDNERGAFEAVSCLTRAGCRRIAFIRGTAGHYFTQATQRGYERALREAGIALDESLCAEGEFHVSSGYEAMRKIMARAGRPEAVFSNDEMAVGALRALKQEGVRVPEDAMVFGFDNLALAEIVDPPLSTVKVDFEYMARTAVRKVIENSRSEKIVPVDIVIPVELVMRETTRRNT